MRSSAVVPLFEGGSVTGGLSVGMVLEERDWPDDLIARLRLLADIFANALARQRAARAAQESAEQIRDLARRLMKDRATWFVDFAETLPKPSAAMVTESRDHAALTACYPLDSKRYRPMVADGPAPVDGLKILVSAVQSRPFPPPSPRLAITSEQHRAGKGAGPGETAQE
jgi:hypothetical protein